MSSLEREREREEKVRHISLIEATYLKYCSIQINLLGNRGAKMVLKGIISKPIMPSNIHTLFTLAITHL